MSGPTKLFQEEGGQTVTDGIPLQEDKPLSTPYQSSTLAVAGVVLLVGFIAVAILGLVVYLIC